MPCPASGDGGSRMGTSVLGGSPSPNQVWEQAAPFPVLSSAPVALGRMQGGQGCCAGAITLGLLLPVQSSAGAVITQQDNSSQALEMELGAQSWERGYRYSNARARLQLCPGAKGKSSAQHPQTLGKFGSVPDGTGRAGRVLLPPHSARDISAPSAEPRHIPCTGLNPAAGPPHPRQSVLNQCHPKEFDVLALMEQVVNWEKPALLVGPSPGC